MFANICRKKVILLDNLNNFKNILNSIFGTIFCVCMQPVNMENYSCVCSENVYDIDLAS